MLRLRPGPAFLLGVVVAVVLAGCEAVPQVAGGWNGQRAALEALDEWQLRGRVNVRRSDESHTLRILWRHEHRDYDIRLWGAFNAGNTSIKGDPGGVRLESGGEMHVASRPEELVFQRLGHELPVSQLEYWIRGLPAPPGDAELRFGELGELRELEQGGWLVQYADQRQYGELRLPGTVDVSRQADAVRLRFIGLHWTISERR